ncbi:all-trans-retinol 13,14-reductase [Taibaiella sp. KBW10]|uniref:phytoene desaturase family protein n=1 Tax=Taibaiella sp. KBW10 TaxID=2153357 RepID=UPI000F58FFEA|nr:NAD(P)/FAD-dependent oxidoreductase [Taibaiella sp. KBW10]RQO30866.1 all-trans-retinol 13,14-reductase [Taibaiella sp. KBW10]
MKHQIVIIGSGLGGLLTAVLLAKEGYDVAIIEQNKQIGGCLQTFSFDKKIFDSAVHYLGSLGEGEVLNQIFSYAGIQKDLQLKRLDQDCFDAVLFGSDPQQYKLAQGLDNFADSLWQQFPEEKEAINAYTRLLQDTCDRFPLYNLRNGDAAEKEEVLHLKLAQELQKITTNQTLQKVLSGNAILYAGMAQKTAFSTHALVSKSYIDSSWRCVGGSSQIAKLLWRKLQEYGGVIYRHEKIKRLVVNNGIIEKAVAASGNEFLGTHFIANIHPQQTIALLSDQSILKSVFKNRILEATPTVGCIMVNIVLKPRTVSYKNYNINWNLKDGLEVIDALSEFFPVNYSIYYTEDSHNHGFAESVSILSYINTSDFAVWKNSFNSTMAAQEREPAYTDFKEEKAVLLINKVAERFPELKEQMQSYKIATPLTYRDYQGSVTGDMYGIQKDVNQLNHTRFTTKTRIPNLHLTGQNINLHGVLGVSMTAISSAADFLGLDYLLQKINEA